MMLLFLVDYLAQCVGGLRVEPFQGGHLLVKVAQHHTFNRNGSGRYGASTKEPCQRAQCKTASAAKMVTAASA